MASELTLNAGLLIEILETDTLDDVTFLIMRVCVSLFPTATVPYDTDDGVDVKGGVDELVVDPEPLPLNGTVSNTVPLLFFTVKLPVTVPDTVGLNPIAK
jgi:hypothetical protein